MEGIYILGGTCAINSLIQMICRCKKLRECILNTNVSEGTFTSELREIIDLLHNKKQSLHPAKFMDFFYKTFDKTFHRYEQIDINELWFYVFEKINEETAVADMITDNISSIRDEHDYKISMYNNRKTSSIMKLVQGSFINIIECKNCGHKSHSFEPFITIALDINEVKTIADLFISTLTDEHREKDDWTCNNCKGNHKYLMMKRIWKLPEIIFISLNRFKDIYHKNNTDVYVNERINFVPGSVLSDMNNNHTYKLQAIGLHYGNLQGGHYMSVCNINDETFNLYNDNHVQSMEKSYFIEHNLKNNSAYLIIYELL